MSRNALVASYVTNWSNDMYELINDQGDIIYTTSSPVVAAIMVKGHWFGVVAALEYL